MSEKQPWKQVRAKNVRIGDELFAWLDTKRQKEVAMIVTGFDADPQPRVWRIHLQRVLATGRRGHRYVWRMNRSALVRVRREAAR